MSGERVMRRYDRRWVVVMLFAILVLDTWWGDEACSCDRSPRVHALVNITGSVATGSDVTQSGHDGTA